MARGPLGFYSLAAQRVPSMDEPAVRTWLDRNGGSPVVVAGLPARRSSRRDTIGRATDVPIEETFVVDAARGWAYQLMTASVPSKDAETFFATFRVEGSVAPRDDREVITRSAREVLARHAPSTTRCRRELEALRDHDPLDTLAEVSYRAGSALTHCGQACEDKVAAACTLLHDLLTTPFLPTTCRLERKHCIDICAFPSDDTVATAVCELVTTRTP